MNIPDNSIEAVVSFFRKALIPFYDKEEIEQFIFISFNEIIGFSRADVLLKKADKINESDLITFSSVVKQLKNNCPIQYIFGRTEFYGMPLKVTKNVLIPRPETEELVQWIINENKNPNGSILDIGTGSGCIAIALKKNISAATVFALDISAEAVKVAKENAELNQVEINFSEQNILTVENENNFPKFDIIVSNPPYVCVSEKQNMKENVLNYEPHLALFVADDEPLLFYKKIIAFAKKKLNPTGKLFFEINESQGEVLVAYLKKSDAKNIHLKKDLSGKNRMLQCQF